jgi:shikimate kinase
MLIGSDMRIFLVGPPGVGKSTVGRYLAAKFGMPFFDLDEVIEERAGANIPWIFDVEGELGFRDRETQVVRDLASQGSIVVATGGGVVLRPENRAMLSQDSTVVYLTASLSALVDRTSGNKKRPLLAGKDTRQVLQKLMAQRAPFYAEIADITVASSGGSPRKLAGVIAEKVVALASSEDLLR